MSTSIRSKLSEEHKKKISMSLLGLKRSNEFKNKCSLARKNKPGHKQSILTREKIARANRGRRHSKEVRQKIRTALMGHEVSKKTRKKIGSSHLGNKNWLGKKHSEESKQKMSISRTGLTGDKSHNWRGGATPLHELIRHSKQLKSWRKACLERDGFTCQKYGTRGGNIIVHHINNFADFLELRTSIENGITLSKKAHTEFHKKYGYNNNTKEQLEEFLKS